MAADHKSTISSGVPTMVRPSEIFDKGPNKGSRCQEFTLACDSRMGKTETLVQSLATTQTATGVTSTSQVLDSVSKHSTDIASPLHIPSHRSQKGPTVYRRRYRKVTPGQQRPLALLGPGSPLLEPGPPHTTTCMTVQLGPHAGGPGVPGRTE